MMQSPFRAVSPRYEYVEELLASDGSIRAGNPILRLGALELERGLMKTQFQIKIVDLAAERLTDAYLDTYVFGPMNAMTEMRKAALGDKQQLIEYLAAQQKYVGTTPQSDVDKASADGEQATAEKANADDSLEKKRLDINGERASKDAERLQLVEAARLGQTLLDLSIVRAPVAGRLSIKVVAGLFVEKGDLLFEIAF